MPSVADKIIKRVSEQDSRSWVCTPKDFLDLGSREAADQTQSRLVKAGRLRDDGVTERWRGKYERRRNPVHPPTSSP